MYGLKGSVSSSVQIFSDLDKMCAEFNPPATVPPHILVTSHRPNIVIIVGNNLYISWKSQF